ncbi:hypothetical protein KZX47_11630 [Thermus sp. SYSU G05001]|uniref:PIN domain-containing protein n=1 Tax=Thermus brevis TaxID=2862456 RepID=A0ABS7A0G2_9DEIN|nr:hypothetical protein [Thermus brevis]MBW6395796.1 hypothetical protein [Thermus brevis]
MSVRKLPKELFALIHHIELNKAGWWDQAIQQLLLFMLWVNDNQPTTLSELANAVKQELGVAIPIARAQEQADQLAKHGTLVMLAPDKVKLSETAFNEVGKKIEQAQKIEESAKASFVKLAKEFCPSLQPGDVWDKFNTNFLTPLIQDMGAYTFSLLTGSPGDSEEYMTALVIFEKFLSLYPEQHRPHLRNLITEYLTGKDPHVRSYILRTLNAHFYIEASGLREEVLHQLKHTTQKTLSFKIFIDTNVLFSILELHSNPSNEAARSLMELCKHLPDGVSVRFYVTKPTLREAQRVLTAVRNDLRGIRMVPNLTAAGASANLSGIHQEFFKACAKDPSLDASRFFDPYINNLLTLLRKRNVELFNESLDKYLTDKTVLKDIQEQLDYEERKAERKFGKRAKTYEALEHDMILWHFVREKRPAYVESPLDAEYWVVSVDYRFLSFDRHKTADGQTGVRVCIHPSALVQMLQFWIPRSEVLEEAILYNLRLPFFFRDFDLQAETTTLAILKTLSRFEKVEDLPLETVTELLLNDSLRARINSVPEEEQIKLVKETLIEEHTRLAEEHSRLKGMLKQTKLDVEKKTKDLDVLEEELKRARERQKQLEEQVSEAKREINKLRVAIHTREEEENRRRQHQMERRRVMRFLYLWVLPPLPVILMGGLYSGRLVSALLSVNVSLALGVAFGLSIILWLLLISYLAGKALGGNHRWVQCLIKVRKIIWALVSSVLVGVIVDAILEFIKMIS